MSTNFTLLDDAFRSLDDGSVVSDGMLFVFRVVNYVIVCQGFAVLGCITNVINMVIFTKIGLSNSINVSFFAISLADFGSCFTMILATIGLNPWVSRLDLPFDPVELQFVIAAPPHVIFTKITTVMTAFLTFERCICVALPLKVKSIITCKRVKIFVVATYLIVTATSIPIPYSYRLKWKFSPLRNKTLLGLVFSHDHHIIQRFVLPFHNFFYSISIFIFITICTVILVTNLQRKASWRQTAMTAEASKDVSTKEKKIAQTVILISTLFIACFLPTVVLLMMMIADKELTVAGKRANLLYTLASFTLTLETVNAAINLFIYYHHSSDYNAMFKLISKIKSDKK